MLIRFSLLLIVTPFLCAGQLSPPGLDGAKAVTWAAAGFTQALGPRWTISMYAGGEFQSSMSNYQTLKKPGIFVINQETMYSFSKKWSLAACTSLRWQELYNDKPPYSPQTPSWRMEARYYARLFYKNQAGQISYALSLRPEYRAFYDTHGNSWASPAQQRYRFKAQGSVPLNPSGTNTFIFADEWLYASDEDADHRWSKLSFSENRLSTYIRHAFARAYVDLGFMHQFWRDEQHTLRYTTYFGMDIILRDPFGRRTTYK